MDKETIVYGCIRDLATRDEAEAFERRRVNRMAIRTLPSSEDFQLLSRDMFSLPTIAGGWGYSRSQIIHFGSSYHAVEYEWNEWIKKFESLLRRMYWVTAHVHLETELTGTHTFCWEAEKGQHRPEDDEMQVRCEWQHHSSISEFES